MRFHRPHVPAPLAWRASLVASLIVLFGLPSLARAGDGAPRWDVEIDPAAYALRGYSVHLGRHTGHLRYDLGAYALDVPQWAHRNPGFAVSTRGIGIKAQYFANEERHDGWFAGAAFGPVRERLRNRGAEAQRTRTLYGAGVEAGYRLDLGHGFYATPWAGLYFTPRARDIDVGGKTYDDRRVTPFAAVHLGHRF